MAQEPRADDSMGVSARPQPWSSDPSNGSALPAAANATSNTAESPDGYKFFFPVNDFVFIVALFISLCGLVGNGTVIWLLSFRVKRNAFSVYILNLASADFTFLLFLSVRFTLFLLRDYIPLSKKFYSLFTFTSYMAGLSLLMAISIERCVAVLFPIWYKCHRPAHLSSIVCALIWGLSLCLGMLVFLCSFFMYFLCYRTDQVMCVMLLLTFLVLCVSSLTLVIRVQCGYRRRPSTKLYKVTLLTVLTFLLLGLPVGVSFLVNMLLSSTFNYDIHVSLFYLLSALNSGANPFIYFFVGRQRHQQGRKSLREMLQSAMTDDM